jgi:hypothetical protein
MYSVGIAVGIAKIMYAVVRGSGACRRCCSGHARRRAGQGSGAGPARMSGIGWLVRACCMARACAAIIDVVCCNVGPILPPSSTHLSERREGANGSRGPLGARGRCAGMRTGTLQQQEQHHQQQQRHQQRWQQHAFTDRPHAVGWLPHFCMQVVTLAAGRWSHLLQAGGRIHVLKAGWSHVLQAGDVDLAHQLLHACAAGQLPHLLQARWSHLLQAGDVDLAHKLLHACCIVTDALLPVPLKLG